MNWAIDTTGFTKCYGRVRAVNSVDLQVGRGQDHHQPRLVGHDPSDRRLGYYAQGSSGPNGRLPMISAGSGSTLCVACHANVNEEFPC